MTDLDIISASGIAFISSYLTAAIFAETTPIINDEGEEEYTLAGYLLLASACLIKLPIKLLFKITEDVEENVPTESVKSDSKIVTNDHELIV